MLNLPEFFKSDYSMILDLMHPELIWMLSTGGLLPYCIAVIAIIFLLLYFITKKFLRKKSLTTKNYILICICSLVIYYFLWVMLLTFFAISLGRISQYI